MLKYKIIHDSIWQKHDWDSFEDKVNLWLKENQDCEITDISTNITTETEHRNMQIFCSILYKDE